MLQIHNTLTGKNEDFKPMDESIVRIYTCGPTVYSEPHIGNWVAYLRWDILVRTLHELGYKTNRVMNVTDVGHLTDDGDDGEDKMQKGARREGITAWDVAKRYTDSFIAGMTALNILPPEHLTKATDHIDIQISLVKTLEDKGYTYQIDDGVYFDTSKFPSYADFAKLDLESLKAGARVEFNQQKRNPSDFALWKLSNPNEKRDMEWDSPWGKGFPGWHLECSAMAMEYLGPTLDIHTGGIDHIPVHHTNEIAQSEAATGKRFSNYWLHCSHLLSDGTKLSKSLGNSYTLSQVSERGYSPMEFRMFIMQSHYRTETNFTWDNLEAASNRLKHWKSVASLRWQINDTLIDDDVKDDQHDINGKIQAAPHAALEKLADDLNTPQALMIIDEILADIETANIAHLQKRSVDALINWIDNVLGLDLDTQTPDITDDQKRLIIERFHARTYKDWAHSDKIRDELLAQGIILKDTAHHTIWSRA